LNVIIRDADPGAMGSDAAFAGVLAVLMAGVARFLKDLAKVFKGGRITDHSGSMRNVGGLWAATGLKTALVTRSKFFEISKQVI